MYDTTALKYGFSALGLLLVLCASAQTTVDPSQQSADPCRAQVAVFERAMGLIRQAQGNLAAAELKEKLLPAKMESEILLKDGYCGLAKYLREKKLDR